MIITPVHKEQFINSTFMKEYVVGLAMCLYPSYKIKKVFDYAFSDDNTGLSDSVSLVSGEEEKKVARNMSILTACIANLYMAILAQKILGVFRKNKYRPLLIALSLLIPTWIESYPFLREQLKSRNFTPIQSKLIMGVAAVTSLAAANTFSKAFFCR